MINAFFGDIRETLITELKKADESIYIAVAWFTDKLIFDLLVEKARDQITVKLILVKDEINLNNQFDYEELIRAKGIIKWDNHHHKFCIIDRRVLITGSYNWTYAANNRACRENILVVENEANLINAYFTEYKTLLKEGQDFEMKPEVQIIEKPVEVPVDKIIEKVVFVNQEPVIQYVDKPVEIIVEKKIVQSVEVYSLYEKRGQYFCPKCHKNKIIEHPKAPKSISSIARYYCSVCNIYFDENQKSILS